jgi:hypothetical protein
MIDPELNLLTAIIIVLNVNIHSMICGVEYEVRSLVVIVWPGDGWVTCEKNQIVCSYIMASTVLTLNGVRVPGIRKRYPSLHHLV